MFSISRVRIFFRISTKIRGIKTTCSIKKNQENIILDNGIDEVLTDDGEYNDLAKHYFQIGQAHNCLVIQPYIKWGRQKLKITPEEQLEEAIALIKTLPMWKVLDTVSIPLDTLDRKTLFKSGSMDRLKSMIQKNTDISAVFINTSNLKRSTTSILQENFHVPILDRYRIVMQILKIHAVSKHAKLQVALAELYYIQRKAQKNLMFGSHDPENLKLMFQEREQKLKSAIKDLRNQRVLLRNKRNKLDYPVIAVVGYTNAGKTRLIKALTGEESLQPKDKLFATLDVTLHSGLLPSGLEVLYVDTVGFISDIPTNLIECFVATLEDAVLADLIIYVEDLSSSCFEYKRNHVLNTLKELAKQTETENLMKKVVSVGNKCDAVKNEVFDVMPISAKTGKGLDTLKYILENRILEVTSRQKITIKVSNGGEEIRWLYKNATVISEVPDEKNSQYINASVIITQSNLQIFKHYFI